MKKIYFIYDCYTGIYENVYGTSYIEAWFYCWLKNKNYKDNTRYEIHYEFLKNLISSNFKAGAIDD